MGYVFVFHKISKETNSNVNGISFGSGEEAFFLSALNLILKNIIWMNSRFRSLMAYVVVLDYA